MTGTDRFMLDERPGVVRPARASTGAARTDTGSLWVAALGCVDYAQALALQRRLWQARREDAIPDTLLLLSHPPTITLGRRADPAHLLAEPAVLRAAGIEVVKSERGGAATYHGPGQLVGYCIVKLAERGPRDFVHRLEEVLIRVARAYGVPAERLPGDTGVWVKGRKLAALGLTLQRRVTRHGFALNVAPNLAHFQYIVPCGPPPAAKRAACASERTASAAEWASSASQRASSASQRASSAAERPAFGAATSLARERGDAPGEAAVREAVCNEMAAVFGMAVAHVSYADLSRRLKSEP